MRMVLFASETAAQGDHFGPDTDHNFCSSALTQSLEEVNFAEMRSSCSHRRRIQAGSSLSRSHSYGVYAHEDGTPYTTMPAAEERPHFPCIFKCLCTVSKKGDPVFSFVGITI